jgi:hypothetical protein
MAGWVNNRNAKLAFIGQLDWYVNRDNLDKHGENVYMLIGIIFFLGNFLMIGCFVYFLDFMKIICILFLYHSGGILDPLF